MSRRDPAYVRDIYEAARWIGVYTAEQTDKTFAANHLVQDAVLRQLGIIGEAAAALSKDFKDKHPRTKWREIVGFRNLMIHAYWQVDTELVWEIVTIDVPKLIRDLAR